jgi:hypothetical protein
MLCFYFKKIQVISYEFLSEDIRRLFDEFQVDIVNYLT